MPEEQQINPQAGDGSPDVDKLIQELEESSKALDVASERFTAETADIVKKINEEPEIADNTPEEDAADDAEIAAFESEIDDDMNTAILDLATKEEPKLN